MNKNMTPRDLRYLVVFAAFVYLAIKFISVISSLILVLAVSMILAMVLNPAVSWLHKKKIPRQLSASMMAFCVIFLLFMIIYLVIPTAIKEFTQLSKESPQIMNKLILYIGNISEKYGISQKDIASTLKGNSQTLSKISNILLGGATKIGVGTINIIGAAFLIFVNTIYMLANPEPLTKGILKAISPRYRGKAQIAGTKFYSQIKAWSVGVLTGMIFIFLFTWIGLLILGVKQAFLFAVIAGLLEAVPVIGPLLSAVPPIIVGFIQNPMLSVWVAVLFLIIQQIEGNLLIPMIMSRQLSLHPVVVISSVIIMGTLFGIVGVFLATPTSVAVAIIIEEFYINRQKDFAENET